MVEKGTIILITAVVLIFGIILFNGNMGDSTVIPGGGGVIIAPGGGGSGNGTSASGVWNYITRTLTNWNQTTINSFNTKLGYIPSTLSSDIGTIKTSTGYIPSTFTSDLSDIKTHSDYIPSTIATALGYIPSTFTSDLSDIKTHSDYIPSTIATALGYIPSTFTADLADIKTHADYIPSGNAVIITPSASIQIADDTERTTTSTSYALMKSVVMAVTGQVTVYWDINNLSHNAYTQINVNGVAQGTEYPSTSGSYTTTSSETVTVKIGDILQIYGKIITSGTCYCKNFKICGTISTALGVAIS